jgi:hypothetical protein
MSFSHWRIVAAVMAAGTLSGCAAALIPVLAGGVLATNVDSTDNRPAAENTVRPTAAAPAPLASQGPQSAASQAPVPSIEVGPPERAAMATVPQAPPPPRPAPVVTAPLAALQLTSFDPAFARFAEFALAAARSAEADAPASPASQAEPRLLSALLADPVELDGARLACVQEQAPVVVIDLDPAGARFTEPASLPDLPEHAAALAALREAGVAIAWISQSPITQTGAIRSALEGAGLDPRGQDVLVLARDPADRKQVLRDTLAANSCIVAIAGDERADFDERFRYLRNPAAGARLETLIGDGPWFLIRNIFSSTPNSGTPTP